MEMLLMLTTEEAQKTAAKNMEVEVYYKVKNTC